METIEKSGIIKTVKVLFDDKFRFGDGTSFYSYLDMEEIINYLNEFKFIKFTTSIHYRHTLVDGPCTLDVYGSIEEEEWDEIRFIDKQRAIAEGDIIYIKLYENDPESN